MRLLSASLCKVHVVVDDETLLERDFDTFKRVFDAFEVDNRLFGDPSSRSANPRKRLVESSSKRSQLKPVSDCGYLMLYRPRFSTTSVRCEVVLERQGGQQICPPKATANLVQQSVL